MAKLHSAGTDAGGQNWFWYFCPGCGNSHAFTVPRWTFNGDVESPTVRPSLLMNQDDPASRCHLFLTDGKIQFLEDCHHNLKGQTVEMADWEGLW